MKSRVVCSSDKLGVFVWPSESVDKFGWLLLLLLPDCCCCKCWDSWLPGATPRSVFFSSIGGSPTPQLDVELSSGLSWANPLCAWHDRNQNFLLIFLPRLSRSLSLSLSLSQHLFFYYWQLHQKERSTLAHHELCDPCGRMWSRGRRKKPLPHVNTQNSSSSSRSSHRFITKPEEGDSLHNSNQKKDPTKEKIQRLLLCLPKETNNPTTKQNPEWTKNGFWVYERKWASSIDRSSQASIKQKNTEENWRKLWRRGAWRACIQSKCASHLSPQQQNNTLTHSLGVGFTRVVFCVLLFAAFWDVAWPSMSVSFHVPFHFFLYFMYYAVILFFWGGEFSPFHQIYFEKKKIPWFSWKKKLRLKSIKFHPQKSPKFVIIWMGT